MVLLLALIAASAGTEVWSVRFDGTGPAKVGMTLAELNAALHESFSLPADKEEQAWFYVNPKGHPGISFMIEKGRMARVDVDVPGIATVEGLRIGDSQDRVLQVYGARVKVEPHAYGGPEDHYLTVTSSDGGNAIRFETGEGKVVRFYAGRSSAVSYIEGCQ